jgi:xanthine dehydrogenase accessory factor
MPGFPAARRIGISPASIPVDAHEAQRYIADTMPSRSDRNRKPGQPRRPPPATVGGTRAVIASACSTLAHGSAPTLAAVIETSGSTYVSAGSIALFDTRTQTGWLSGGCLEPEIARRASVAASSGALGWMEIDTRDDAALFAGAALGCRGRLRLVLLPLRTLEGWAALGERWLRREGPMEFTIASNGLVTCRVGAESLEWRLRSTQLEWDAIDGIHTWNVAIAPPPLALLYGVGPEAPLLLPLLRSLGWMTHAVEQRPRWTEVARLADVLHARMPAGSEALLAGEQPFAVLVMHHNFELDLEALYAVSAHPPPYLGLLGPRRRRDDLFSLLSAPARERLLPALHSPAGIDLGGRGAEAVALSIAAQMQARWHQHQPGYT